MGLEREHTIRSGQEKRGFTWQQAKLIEGYEIMGRGLAQDLAQTPELRDELSILLHETPLTYEEVVRHFFQWSGRDFKELVTSPFIRSFQATPQCLRSDDAEFLSQMQLLAAGSIHPVPQAAIADFQEWVENRAGFMAKGLQRCILDSGIIEPLTPEEIAKKSIVAVRQWREAHPEQFAAIQKRAAQAAAEAAGPRVFTNKVRIQIQKWFDKGLDYETVVELLKGRGIEINYFALIRAVRRYDDLHYTSEETRERERKGFIEATEMIFELSQSRRRTRDILEKLGHSKAKTERALNKLGLRERIDWTRPVEIEGSEIKLEDVLREFISKGYPTIRDEYQAFKAYLDAKGVHMDIAEGSYKGVRYKMLKKAE